MITASPPVFFESPQAFAAWLAEHAGSARELRVGFYKVATGRPSLRWAEAVDEALCVGWIDGVRQRIDDEAYQIRFTPRRPGSAWSEVNIARVLDLGAQGRLQPAGQQAFERRETSGKPSYSYEQIHRATLGPEHEAEFRRHSEAWAFFERQPPSYRGRVCWRILQARQPATRARRLAALIEASAQQRRL